jgi:iron(III) transport system permease protein
VTSASAVLDAPIRIEVVRARSTRLLGWIGTLGLLAGLSYLVLLPLFRLQQLAFEDGAEGYRRAIDRPRIWRTLTTTIGLAMGSLVISLVLGTLLAWASTRLPRRLGWLRALPVLPIVVPAVAAVTGWSFLFSPRPGYGNALLRLLPWWSDLDEGPIDVYTLPWIILLTGFGLTSFVYLFVSAGFANINTELVEAAQVSGSNSLGVFFRVTLPLLRPALLYGGGVALLLGLGQFTAPLLLGTNSGIRVLTTDMYFSVAQIPVDYATAAAIGSPLLVFGIVVVIVQRVMLGDRGRFVTHGGKAFRSNARPSRAAAALIVVYGLVSTVLPLSALAIVACSKFWTADVNLDELTLDNFRYIFDQPGVTRAITTSLVASISAVAIVLPIGFLTATLLLKGRRYRIVRSAIDLIVTLPLGVPAVVFGVGFLLAYTQEPFVLYGTRWVIILVYVTLMLPFATRMLLSGMIALGDAYVEASRVSGAGAIRTNLRIIVPLLRSTIGGAAALMFVLLTHEFSASLLVRAPTTQVMGTVLYDQWVSGSYPTVAAIALVMTGVTMAGVFLAVLLGGSEIFDKL